MIFELLEEIYNDELNVQNDKREFMNYCAGKIAELGVVTYYGKGEEIEANVAMTGNIRGYEHAKVVVDYNDDWESITILDADNNIIEESSRCTPIEYAFKMEFDKIDTEFYKGIMDYFDGYADIFVRENLNESVRNVFRFVVIAPDDSSYHDTISAYSYKQAKLLAHQEHPKCLIRDIHQITFNKDENPKKEKIDDGEQLSMFDK